VFFLSVVAFSQDYPKAEVFGGYSYLNVDTNNVTSRQSANGWEAAASGNFNKWFGVEFDVSGYYKTYSADLTALGLGTIDVKFRDYSYLAGPRINFRPVFVHALLGGDHLSQSLSGLGSSVGLGSQDGFAGAFGGGVEWKVSGPWSVRASTDYVFTRHNLFGASSRTQNNFRAGAGIVYSLGGKPAVTHAASRAAGHAPERAVMSIPSLGVMAGVRAEGVEIVEVMPSSLAELAYLHVGDVITSIDGKKVNTPMELAVELKDRAAGSQVHLGYMLHSQLGYFPKETVLILK